MLENAVRAIRFGTVEILLVDQLMKPLSESIVAFRLAESRSSSLDDIGWSASAPDVRMGDISADERRSVTGSHTRRTWRKISVGRAAHGLEVESGL